MEQSKTKRQQRKVATAKSPTVTELPAACSDERQAVEFMERQRWGQTPCCVRCGDTDVYQMRDRQTGERNRRWLWMCRGCKRQFTVRVGTIFEDSPIPLRYWCYAFWKACSSKKGISAKQIQREIGVSYNSALFMMHRIRWAMAPVNAGIGPLTGDVEADETYIGGKPRKPNIPGGGKDAPNRRYARFGVNAMPRRTRGPAPDFTDRKTPVFATVQRDGHIKARVLLTVTPKTLRAALKEMVDPTARLFTDESNRYRGVGKEFSGGHETVNHSASEYVRGEAHINTAEGFFGLLKRGVNGTFHSVTRKHLHRYVDEFAFRWNTRKLEDGERTSAAISAASGKRLTHRQMRDAEVE